ncbi:ecto-NOX disulfide-thiol exchanger 1 isoform X4 [Hypanus sabinus]|uniref:ecto-NOX disulfide-thiol exchanger 1 isoform X4 n=1 Tax=Hypanus sabinus TaxID=79690 RepID=UPI0028C43353|nr:ecto-NOX disulfide-thiol exchanger 1 isoform X4 [Hypanus sabinus]
MAAGTEGLEGIVLGPSQISMSVTDTTAWATAMNNLGITPVPLVSDPICMPAFEHGLGLVAGMAPVNPTMTGIGLLRPVVPQELPVVKEIIHCARCTLFPANPNLPPPATRDRPPGCKTVFVGGLPENATEEVIREVFEQCGTITALRKSKKNFCHIRFAEEFMVDKAIYLSGYRMRLGSSTDKKDTGRLHVDFAQARDDFYEWECKQRMFAREERHRRMLEDEQLRPPSPAPIMHYSEHEASLMTEKLKDESRFSEATSVLLAWFERGEVTRRSANNFYSMIQSVNSHSRRLMSEKAAHEQEMEDAKERFKNALAGILTGLEQIVAVFKAASKQKAWDHFSKAQRKNIDMWRKQAEEVRNAHSEELMGIRHEEEMEMSDDDCEESPSKSPSADESGGIQEEGIGTGESKGGKGTSTSIACKSQRKEVECIHPEPDDQRGRCCHSIPQIRERSFISGYHISIPSCAPVWSQHRIPVVLPAATGCQDIFRGNRDSSPTTAKHVQAGVHWRWRHAGEKMEVLWFRRNQVCQPMT